MSGSSSSFFSALLSWPVQSMFCLNISWEIGFERGVTTWIDLVIFDMWSILPIILHGMCFVKSFQLCSTLCNPMDRSLPGSSVHGDSPGRNAGVGCHALLQGIFPSQGLSPHLLRLLHRQAGSVPLAPPGEPGKWCTIVGLVFISLMTGGVEHLFTCLLATCFPVKEFFCTLKN